MAELPDTPISDLNPLLMGKYLYNIVAPYLKNKYNIEYVESYPKERCTTPTITSRIFSRNPGGGKSGMAQATGPSFSRTESYDEFGQVTESHKQQHTLIVEFAVFGTSAPEVDELAWDLETLLVESEGILQNRIEGVTLTFNSQQGDSNLNWDNQDELLVRTVRFKINLPIRYKKILPQIKTINYEINAKRFLTTSPLLERVSSSVDFEIPNSESNLIVKDIASVRKQIGNSAAFSTLYAGVDYQVIVTTPDYTAKIRWIDSSGTPPKPGEKFYVDYWASYSAGYYSDRFPGEIFDQIKYEKNSESNQ